MAKYVQAGAEAMVVCATRGEAGQIRDASVATPNSLGAVREAELREACARLGVQHVAVLDHIDGTLAGLDQGLLVDEVRAVIDEFSPNVVVTFGPDGAYGHPDHVTIGGVTSAACATWDKGRLYHSYFPRSRLLLVHFKGAANFARVFSLFAQESTALGYADDHIDVGWFPPGVSIVEQGEAADALYLILSGVVEVSQIQPDGTRTTLRRSGPGEFFGEIAIAQHSTRTAQVTAVEAVTCLVFTRQAPALWGSRGAAESTAGIGAAANPGDSRQSTCVMSSIARSPRSLPIALSIRSNPR